MIVRPLTRRFSCLVLMAFAALGVRAGTPKLPANAIAEDTFFVATVDLAKVEPATLEATAKAALGDKAGDVDDLLTLYKTHHEKYAGKGAESVTLAMRGDPDKQQGPEPIFYVKFKAGADHGEVEKQIREQEGENNPEALEITHDGDFMVLRKKGAQPPEAGSEERTKLFTDALGDCEKPAVAALIFNDAMVKSIDKDIGHGAPPALADFVKEAKSLRIELTLGQMVAAEVTIQTADEDAAKRVADAVTGLGETIKAQVAQMKQAFAGAPPQVAAQMGPIGEIADAMSAVAEAVKPQQAGAKVTISVDAKTVGAVLRMTASVRKMEAANAPGGKGGL